MTQNYVFVAFEPAELAIETHLEDLEEIAEIRVLDLVSYSLESHQHPQLDDTLRSIAEQLAIAAYQKGRLGDLDFEPLVCLIEETLEPIHALVGRWLKIKGSNEEWSLVGYHKDVLVLERRQRHVR